ncbi:type I-C CRISPR-associated protein Cas8c/Csd1 [Ruficoccus amylovorans]|uniref:Type I-C CRISPR-associated protein Cas8c/Csd1 n=1 Tax=Ruficoccus amylovorans TaxID=1804625 RepID=A0A842HJ00_9BACT|nr:type I-C CRISPR-associated protein Cas8c/Csd1 [Ruficoccus amylovorans]MBC2595161.1 type I-C CRISPR-associated protein Cas8c/Csd1 [Ruficoccus amylovorans]
MILQSLYKLYERLADDPEYGLPLRGFSSQKVSFKLVLKPDGSLLEPQSVDPKVQTLVLGEGKPPGSGINPCFLWDNQTYLLGRQPEDKKDGFGQDRFEAFRARHLAVEQEIGSPAFSAVCRFLEAWNPERLSEYPLLEEAGTGFGVFQIQGERGYVHDDPVVRAWWNKTQTAGEASSAAVLGQCLITGEQQVEIARLHPKIKGVVGAQSAGASIVSFNATAYESYGKEQSYNSPVGEEAAFCYGTALNALLSGPMASRHRLRIGDTSCVFWTEKKCPVEDVFAELLGSGSFAVEEAQDPDKLDQLKRLLKAVTSGGRYADLDDVEAGTPFFLLGLAPNAARLSVRFFYNSTVGDTLERLREHHACMQIVREFEQPVGKRFADPEFPPLWALLRETVRRGDDPAPLLGGALMRAVITGSPYPVGLYAAILRRIQADRTINYLRAATLKAVLVRNYSFKLKTMLDTDNTDPAYLLGRLFAVLEKTQLDALPGLNATIRDRFYSAASATPASVFPRLLRTYQHHLGKLLGGAKVNRERLLQDIMEAISSGGFPRQLNLQEQGIFAIGYYHQRKSLFTAKAKNAEPETSEPATL